LPSLVSFLISKAHKWLAIKLMISQSSSSIVHNLMSNCILITWTKLWRKAITFFSRIHMHIKNKKCYHVTTVISRQNRWKGSSHYTTGEKGCFVGFFPQCFLKYPCAIDSWQLYVDLTPRNVDNGLHSKPVVTIALVPILLLASYMWHLMQLQWSPVILNLVYLELPFV